MTNSQCLGFLLLSHGGLLKSISPSITLFNSIEISFIYSDIKKKKISASTGIRFWQIWSRINEMRIKV